MKKIYIMLILLFVLPTVAAKEGHIKLLAVSGIEGNFSGQIADLYLEITEGKGRVFIDTYPLTKLDTQISTRFAQQIACNFLDINCNNYDFIYTIKSGSTIIGGPSASAAIAALTVATLDNLNLDKNIAITATINSGAIIGPVAGLKEKINAAANNGIKKVLLSKGSTVIREDNTTEDIIEYGRKSNVEIIEVATLDDAMFHFTGKRYENIKGDITISQNYKNTMRYLANLLCNRSEALKKELSDSEMQDNETDSKIRFALNLTERAASAYNKELYYTSASYCFGANVQYSTILAKSNNESKAEAVKKINDIKIKIDNLDKGITSLDKKTMTDLQAFIIVKERLVEAKDLLDNSINALKENKTHYNEELAYSFERLYSAISWSKFFNQPGKSFNLNQDNLRRSCVQKLEEANERISYVQLLFPRTIPDTSLELSHAYNDFDNKDFELCLFKALKAKAEADTVLGVLGVDQDQLSTLIDNRLDVIKKEIIKTSNKNVFPILAYSYYEYAADLKESDPYSALLYLEYALEFADLDHYFEEQGFTLTIKGFDIKIFIAFMLGAVVGAACVLTVFLRKTPKRKYVHSTK